MVKKLRDYEIEVVSGKGNDNVNFGITVAGICLTTIGFYDNLHIDLRVENGQQQPLLGGNRIVGTVGIRNAGEKLLVCSTVGAAASFISHILS